MGLFSIYTGAIYNDVFSKSLNIYGSSFRVGKGAQHALDEHHPEYTLDPANKQDYIGYPYAFGMDPIWQVSWFSCMDILNKKIIFFFVCLFGYLPMLFHNKFLNLN